MSGVALGYVAVQITVVIFAFMGGRMGIAWATLFWSIGNLVAYFVR